MVAAAVDAVVAVAVAVAAVVVAAGAQGREMASAPAR